MTVTHNNGDFFAVFIDNGNEFPFVRESDTHLAGFFIRFQTPVLAGQHYVIILGETEIIICYPSPSNVGVGSSLTGYS